MKQHSEKYLMSWSKKMLVDHIMTLEHNYANLDALYKRVANINMKMIEAFQKAAPEAAKRFVSEVNK